MLKPAQSWANPVLGHSKHGIPNGQSHPTLLLTRQTNQSKLSRADQKTGGMLPITESMQKLISGKTHHDNCSPKVSVEGG